MSTLFGVTLTGVTLAAPAPVGSLDQDAEFEQMAAYSMTIEQGKPAAAVISMPAGRYVDAAGVEKVYATSVHWTCIGRSNNPHYSTGSGGVIAKAQVSCTGTNATLPIKVQQYLGRTTKNSIASLVIVKESAYVQNVTVNTGWSNPWYVPALGQKGATRGAYFRASHAGGTMPPLISLTIKGGASQFVYVP